MISRSFVNTKFIRHFFNPTFPQGRLSGLRPAGNQIFQSQMSNETWAPGCLGYIGDEISYPVIWGILRYHEIRIPIKQPGFHGK